MPEAGGTTYQRLLAHYVSTGVVQPDDSVFVQFAGTFDKEVCASVGLVNCTFANIAPDTVSSGLGSAESFDAHRMPFADSSFDHVIGHAGLHHCSRPHEALYEMFRMARKLVLFVENQDSLLMRLGARTGVVGTYEHEAVRAAGGTSGGVDGTGVPNYIYRWTRREVLKAVRSYDPSSAIPIEFWREWNVGSGRASSRRLRQVLHLRSDATADRVFEHAQRALNAVGGRQGNIFAAAIRKDLAGPVPVPWVAPSPPAADASP
jgi:SAM-dependent methyltransferase